MQCFNVKKIPLVILVVFGLLINGCQKIIIFNNNSFPYIPEQLHIKQKNLALVLGGGGAKGFAHVGVLEELEKAGIVPDAIIGCSAGSIIGALYAANPQAKHLKAIVLDGKRSDVITFGIQDWPYSMYSSKLKQYLQKKLKTINRFEQLKIPFIATATNLQYGNLTAFSQGDLINPVMASAAYPSAFAPIKIKNQYFIDGGVVDPVPVRLAKQLGFKTIIAVNLVSTLNQTNPRHIIGLVKRSTEITYRSLTQYAIEDADIVINFNFNDIGIFTDQYNYYLYEEGKKSTKKVIPKILQLLKLRRYTFTENKI